MCRLQINVAYNCHVQEESGVEIVIKVIYPMLTFPEVFIESAVVGITSCLDFYLRLIAQNNVITKDTLFSEIDN